MILNLTCDEETLVYQTGQQVMSTNDGVVLFGMSPGNPYFKSAVIQDYVAYLGREKRRIVVVVPQQPAEHTYRAMGSKDPVKRAKRNVTKLKSHCRRAIDKVNQNKKLAGDFHMLDWIREVDTHEAYQAALDFVLKFYNDNSKFRFDAAGLTAKVLGKGSNSSDESGSESSELEDDENIQEGVFYFLKELAFIIASKQIFATDNVTVIYYRSFPVYEKFVNGDYDGEPKKGLGLSIIKYSHELLRRSFE